jgi:hypothetical protein
MEESHFKALASPIFSSQIYLTVDESQVVKALNHTVDTFRGLVDIGSYPILENPHYRTRLTFDSMVPGKKEEALTLLRSTNFFFFNFYVTKSFASNKIQESA